MIAQPYVFTGNDPQDVYQRVRLFCAHLHEACINPESLDGIRGNTKYYPDAGVTMTTVEVFPGIATSEQFEAAEHIYAETVRMPLDAQYGMVVQAFCLIKPYEQFTLSVKQDGFLLLENIGEDWHMCFQGVREWHLEEQIRRVLIARHLIEEARPKPSGDEFDPFLDDVDLP